MFTDKALSRAINKVGGPSEFARQLGIKPPSIYKWQRVPAERVLAVERISGVSRHKLRPDIYPAERR
jgi:DNA-binding transcriptional regulator YdaS (Cro superfamily)